MVHLCRAEIVISLCFLLHGVYCPGYPEEAEYQSTCHMNTVAALCGTLTGALGIGAVHRYRWRTMLVVWLVCCIISAVGNLLSVITTGIWLDHLSKMKDRTGLVNGLSGFMLLASVAVGSNKVYPSIFRSNIAGVCFILTAVMICHYWNSNSPKYQAVGKIAKRARSVRRRLSRMKSGEKTAKGYHVV
ncbi:hypothetical protein WR25_16256 isoform E [Diploscapter pachys]|uniref:Uncharacterized protein n=1 Tax=Diploscapter pachys TaxID=2018661 RepID=A0A2A2J913_9BILA|nr:hypothetical protein WR25_16256 isoform C [Diploscapter pachys]PAV58024.1 hypothetical protein WR25_16256 isoform E [Diploscapter pachys]